MGQVFSYFFNYIFGKSQKSLKDKEDELLYDVYLLMSGGESRFLDEESSNMDIKLSKRDEDHFFNLATAYRRMHDTDDFFEVIYIFFKRVLNLCFPERRIRRLDE